MTAKLKIKNYKYTLVGATYREMVRILTKCMAECASFDPAIDSPEQLRKKYLPLYAKLKTLLSDLPNGNDFDDLFMYAASIKQLDFISGKLVISFRMTISSIETEYVLHLQNECGEFQQAAIENLNAVDASKVQHRYQMV